MVIGVDGNEANVKKRVGVSVYTLNLLRYFKKQSNSNLEFKIYLKNSPLRDLPDQDNFFRYEVVSGKFLWSQIFLPLRLYRKRDIDAFFSPAHYIPRFCPVPTVVTIHDLAYLYFENDFLKKDLYQLKSWTKYSVNKASKIIAVSKSTKNDLIKSYDVPEDKIDVIYNGYEKKSPSSVPLSGTSEGRQKLKIRKPFILFVGTVQPRKNLSLLIDSFNLFLKTNREFNLVIAGKKGWLFKNIFEKVKKLKLENNVIFTDYVSDQELIWFYKNAFCFVLPSLYEGFGLPVLEAMSYGCPTVVSTSSSLKEIGGNASLYFNSENSFELVEKLTYLKTDSELRENMIKKGFLQIKKFSWDNCGRQTLEVIKKSLCIRFSP